MELDTNSDLFPEGTYRFRITDVPEQGTTPGGYMFFKFTFAADVDGDDREYSERFMRWTMAPICLALGFPETKPGKFQFEPAACMGRFVTGTIAHEKIEKGSSAGKVVARMKEIRADAGEDPKKVFQKAQAPTSEIPF